MTTNGNRIAMVGSLAIGVGTALTLPGLESLAATIILILLWILFLAMFGAFEDGDTQ